MPLVERILPRLFFVDASVAVVERLVSAIGDVAQLTGYATNADDAMTGINHSNPHLVVIDIAIANGIDLLGHIKNHQPPVIVVVLTHSVEDAMRRVCLRMGAGYFLDKHYAFDKVRGIVIAVGGGLARTALD